MRKACQLFNKRDLNICKISPAISAQNCIGESGSRREDAPCGQSWREDVPPQGAPADQSCHHKHLQLRRGGRCAEAEPPHGMLRAASARDEGTPATQPGISPSGPEPPAPYPPLVPAPQQGPSPARCQGRTPQESLSCVGREREGVLCPCACPGAKPWSSRLSTTKVEPPPLRHAQGLS